MVADRRRGDGESRWTRTQLITNRLGVSVSSIFSNSHFFSASATFSFLLRDAYVYSVGNGSIRHGADVRLFVTRGHASVYQTVKRAGLYGAEAIPGVFNRKKIRK